MPATAAPSVDHDSASAAFSRWWRRCDTIVGVDFSGAALAGNNIWLARVSRSSLGPKLGRLTGLDPCAALAGAADRETVLPWLVDHIARSDQTLWAIDFPFGLPVELFDQATTWSEQLASVAQWPRGANEFGRWCVARAVERGHSMHVRRTTDTLSKTPFDCYHYRIIYQTFHGMRDLLLPLTTKPMTAVLPFQYQRLPTARQLVLEACPSSTLKRWGVPHQNYKQPAGGPLTSKRRAVRAALYSKLRELIEIPPDLHRRITRNPGGDALDAVVAAAGVLQSIASTDHAAIASDPRHPREGYVFF